MNSTVIYKSGKAYREILLATEIEDLNDALKKHLIEFIKEKVI